MDTSNRQPEVAVDWVKFVTGEATVTPDKVSPEKLLELIRHVLHECGPFLKYFPDFVPVEKTMPEFALGEGFKWCLTFADPVDPGLKCLEVGRVSRTEVKEGDKVISASATVIFLSLDKNLLCWKYEKSHAGFKTTEFYSMTEEQILDLLARQPNWIDELLRKLWHAAFTGIQRRETYLMHMRRIVEHLAGIRGRME